VVRGWAASLNLKFRDVGNLLRGTPGLPSERVGLLADVAVRAGRPEVLQRRVATLGQRDDVVHVEPYLGWSAATVGAAEVVAAVFCSLIEFAKLCGVEPRVCLREATLRAVRNPGMVTPREISSLRDSERKAAVDLLGAKGR
jgi:hypothetical protein